MDAWTAAIHPDDRDWAISFCQAETTKGLDHEFTYRALRADGEVVWIQDVVTVVPGPNGPERLMGLMRDVTLKTQAEAERVRLEEQVRQAQRLEALGTLAGGIAHDFNNILGAIIGFAEIESLATGAEAREGNYLGQLLTAAHRAKDLVRQILAFSRRDQELRRPVAIAEVLEETLQLLRSTLPRTIAIETHIDTPGLVLGETSRLHQIVMNLCTNAYHAMREGGGVLSVGLAHAFDETRGGNSVIMTISDTGHGMDAETLERIYEPYYTTKVGGEGTGLGLSVAHGIVRADGGAIRCESVPGKGTTFHVSLPALQLDATKSASRPGTQVAGGSETILVVDDEPALSYVTKEMLESLGYRVTATTNSREAFECFAAAPTAFDAVVTDQNMPGITGVELARRVLALRPALPIILCSGHSDMVDERSAQAMGIAAYVQKPYKRMELARAVRDALDARQPANR